MSNALFGLYCMVSLLAVGNPVWAQGKAKAVPASAAKQSLVLVHAYKNNEKLGEASGFVINKVDNVLTSAHVLVGADRITVFSLRQTAEISAKKVYVSHQQNLALLYVQGLGLPPLSFSQDGDDIEGNVQVPQFTSETSVGILEGEITRHHALDAGEVQLLQHNALITRKEFGMPVFNACGQVIAINQPVPISGRWPGRYEARVSPTTVYALRSVNIKPVLESRARFTLVKESCLSKNEEVLKRNADEIKGRVGTIKKNLDETEKALKKTTDDLKGAIEHGKNLQGTIEDMSKEIYAVVDSIAKKQDVQKDSLDKIIVAKEEESESRWLWTIFGGGGLALLVFIGWLVVSSKQKAQAAPSAAAPAAPPAAPPTAPTTLQEPPGPRAAPLPPPPARPAAPPPQSAPFGCLLEGQDSATRSYTVNIPANKLGDPVGVALGKKPDELGFCYRQRISLARTCPPHLCRRPALCRRPQHDQWDQGKWQSAESAQPRTAARQ